jgi:DNA-binding MarR family transcriptional regulator
VSQDQLPADLNEAIRFGFLVHDVSRLRRVVLDRLLKPVGVTRSQWWVLSHLSRRDGMTQTALASDLDLTKVAVGGLLDRMEVAGLVQRRPDENDARIRRVYLTRAGHRLIGQVFSHIDSFERAAVGPASDEDLAVTIRALRRMKEVLLERIGDSDDHGSRDHFGLAREDPTF